MSRLGRGASRLAPQRLDQAFQLGIVWLGLRKLLGVFERTGEVARLAVEADKRGERVAVSRMPREIVLQRLDRIGAAPARIEPNRIDIGIAGAVGLELGGAGKLGDRLVLLL